MSNMYVKKPISIEAEQILTGDAEASPFVNEAFRNGAIHFTDRGFLVDTLEGHMFADYGAYLVRGIDGEYYPCKQTIFERSYDKENTNA